MQTIMESFGWPAYSLALFATFFLISLSGHLRHRKLNLPPGPKPWPIIGNLHLIGSLPHRSFHELSRKYGPLLHLRLGSIPVVVASSVYMAKAFLKTHDLTFAGRPVTLSGKFLGYNHSDIVSSPYGPYWRQGRKLFALELFSLKRLESFEYIRKEEMNIFLKGLYHSTGRVVDIRDHLSDLSLNIISRMVLGKKYLDRSEYGIMSPEEFKHMLNELFFLSGDPGIGDALPWLNFLDLQGYVKRMKVTSKTLDRFLEHVLDEHNATREGVKNYVAKDMVDVLLQFAEDPDLDVKLERHGVKAFIMNLIAGGTDTSTVTTEWAMAEMLRKPEVFEKAREELDNVIGKERWVEENDVASLPYIEAIVKETMRLHPVGPLLIPRMTREDCKIDGYDIAKGTMALVNVWTIGRDPKLWDHPNEFCPERFMGNAIDIAGQNYELLPFGSGRRMCPGYNLGRKVVESSIANLLHGFQWKLPENMKEKDLNMEEAFGLTIPRKFPLTAVPEPRLPLHVYALQ